MTRGWLLVALPLLAACTGDRPTARDLDPAVAMAYGHLYVRQQTVLGRTGVTEASTAAAATCERGGPGVLDQGAGDDWTCSVAYTGVDGQPRRVLYEVTVTPDGCYRADGPPGVVGQSRVPLPAGGSASNPLYGFDGCVQP